MNRKAFFLIVVCGLLTAGTAFAEEVSATPPPAFNSGDTAWMLVSSLLVLMMTVPGLALFYGGLVKRDNVLATLMQSLAICAIVSVLWPVIGYT
ncbi:MAG: ammonium transporter, partial [Alphaproteobacteria bacterium]|nr:ammonium transporter [Alphaproteobacteria bacterium]